MNGKWLLTMLMGLSVASPAKADNPPTTGTGDNEAQEQTQKPPVDKDQPGTPDVDSPGTQDQLAKLAAKFGTTESEILTLRQQGLGWGEIGLALAIAQKAGVPVSQVVALRQSGMGWGQIAQKYGFKLGTVAREGRKTGKALRRAFRADEREEHEKGRPTTNSGHEERAEHEAAEGASHARVVSPKR